VESEAVEDLDELEGEVSSLQAAVDVAVFEKHKIQQDLESMKDRLKLITNTLKGFVSGFYHRSLFSGELVVDYIFIEGMKSVCYGIFPPLSGNINYFLVLIEKYCCKVYLEGGGGGEGRGV